MLNIVSLFSGVGAFELGLKYEGISYNLVNFCEVDKYAIKSYCVIHNEDENKNLGDITQITKEKLPKERVNLVVHGSPCQDFSPAGKQAGGEINSGTRSSLLWYTVGIVKHLRPEYIIWENIKNVLSKNHKPVVDKYIQYLEGFGYNSYVQEMNTKHYGLPQNRPRVFIVSILKKIDKGFVFPKTIPLTLALQDLLEDKVSDKYNLSSRMKRYITANNEKWTGNNNKSLINRTVASTINTGEGTRRCDASNYICNTLPKNFNLKTLPSVEHTIRKLTPLECFRLQGFKDEEYHKCKAIKISDTQLRKQMGNTISVPVVQAIFRELFKNA